MEVASLMAAHWMSTERSAALSARSRSLENVAMPHCRGGQVATNAMDRLCCNARFGCLSISDSRCGLRPEPLQHVSNLSGHQANGSVGRTVVHTQFARWHVQHGATGEDNVRDVAVDLVIRLRSND